MPVLRCCWVMVVGDAERKAWLLFGLLTAAVVLAAVILCLFMPLMGAR